MLNDNATRLTKDKMIVWPFLQCLQFPGFERQVPVEMFEPTSWSILTLPKTEKKFRYVSWSNVWPICRSQSYEEIQVKLLSFLATGHCNTGSVNIFKTLPAFLKAAQMINLSHIKIPLNLFGNAYTEGSEAGTGSKIANLSVMVP